MDNVINSCIVGDEEASVNKAGSCTGSKRRLVRQKTLVVMRQSKQIFDSDLSKFQCICNNMVARGTVISETKDIVCGCQTLF